MKAVLISIRPEWCDLIVRGEKTLEVRKNRPKLDVPFKCYIYCTLSGSNEFFRNALNDDVAAWNRWKWGERKGNIIGEFICDAILPMSIEYSDPNSRVALKEFPGTCLTDKQIIDYFGNGVTGYVWHISNLKIYEKPLRLENFFHACDKPSEQNCSVCEESGKARCKQLIRAPQSWCYVMEV